MNEERVAIVDLADELQVRKQRIFKLLPRLGIRPIQRRDVARGNQNVATISFPEAAAIRNEIERSPEVSVSGDSSLSVATRAPLFDDVGFFYLIQLEPAHDAGRFKVGFTTELEGRLQKHRCAAPFAQYMKTWPCRRLWERAAIDCAANGCEQLHTEVFRTSELERVAARADAFFALMPNVSAPLDDDLEGEAPSLGGTPAD